MFVENELSDKFKPNNIRFKHRVEFCIFQKDKPLERNL